LNGEPIHHLQWYCAPWATDSVGQTVTLGLRRAGETSPGVADNRREGCHLTKEAATELIRLALNITDAALADRLAALLAGVPGLRLVVWASQRKFLL
jgi:hypothetical protein